MGVFRGKAMLSWVDSDDTTTERVLLLREPLRELRPAHDQAVYVADSLDKTNRQTFTTGEGVDELVGNVRYQDDPQGLLDLIKAGTKGRTITYVPDLRDADRRYACVLIAPLSPVGLGMDRDRGVTFGELEVEIQLRKTDETPFADPWKHDRLFSWRAGGRMEEATYSRADVASYVALAGGGGYGTLTTAASGAARTHWMSTASSVGPRTFPTLLLEDQRTNRVLQSENFGSTKWTKSTVTATTGQTDPRGGTKAALLSDASTTVQGDMSQNITLTISTRATISTFMGAGTTISSGGSAFLLISSAGITRAQANVTWSSGRPTVAVIAGVSVGLLERYRGGWYRFGLRSTGNLSTGTYTIRYTPAQGAAARKGNVYIFGAQVEQ